MKPVSQDTEINGEKKKTYHKNQLPHLRQTLPLQKINQNYKKHNIHCPRHSQIKQKLHHKAMQSRTLRPGRPSSLLLLLLFTMPRETRGIIADTRRSLGGNSR